MGAGNHATSACPLLNVKRSVASQKCAGTPISIAPATPDRRTPYLAMRMYSGELNLAISPAISPESFMPEITLWTNFV